MTTQSLSGPAPTRRAVLKRSAGLATLAAAGLPPPTHARQLPAKPIRWVVFYGTQMDETVLAKYDVVVLDPWFAGSVSAVAREGARVCGYLSIGEIRTADPLFRYVEPNILLGENLDWPGTQRVDIRHPSWRDLVLDRFVPLILAKGYSGLMFDTLDTPAYLEEVKPRAYAGMRQAAIDLVATIRLRWPRTTLIMNRGYAILPDLAGHLDGIIAESLITTPGERETRTEWVEPDILRAHLELLRPASARRPPLPILSLDYWDTSDIPSLEKIYQTERNLGHHPYVTTRLLDQVTPEPNRRK